MGTYLDGIVAWHRARAAGDDRDLASLKAEALAWNEVDPPRDFAGALRRVAPLGDPPAARASSSVPALIAEVKRRSPSKGDLAPGLHPEVLAAAYESAGASCLSVLTDAPHFGGSPADLAAARSATSLPVLRKDFTVAAADVCDARLMGADAVLLIVAALARDELAGLLGLADELGLAALVEVHDGAEAAVAIEAGAVLVGVNQRDLRSFAVDADRAVRTAGVLPGGVVKVAESGISSHTEAVRLAEAGYDAVLVGEHLVTAADPAEAAALLLHGPVVPCG